MPPVNLGLHFPGIGSLLRLKLRPGIARKMLLEAHRWTGEEALRDGIVDVVATPNEMFERALELARKWAPKAKMGMPEYEDRYQHLVLERGKLNLIIARARESLGT